MFIMPSFLNDPIFVHTVNAKVYPREAKKQQKST